MEKKSSLTFTFSQNLVEITFYPPIIRTKKKMKNEYELNE